MRKRAGDPSVTTVACKCPWLDNAANEPDVPIEYDPEMAEYHLIHKRGGWSVLRHCPWCGGRAPESKRACFFATITAAEQERVERLTAKLATVEDAIAVLGKPDRDDPRGTTIKMPASATEPQRVQSYRTLEFANVSQTVVVSLIDYGPKGIGFSFHAKPLGKRPRSRRAPGRRSPKRPRGRRARPS